MGNQPQIVFHHIPKCGGTSLVRGMVLAYHPFRFLRLGKAGFRAGLNNRAALSACELCALDRLSFARGLLAYQLERGDSPIIYGHYPFSEEIYNAFKDRWSFITILRHPLDRWYSQYFYNRYKTKGSSQTTLDMTSYLESEAGRFTARTFVNHFIEVEDPVARASEREAQLTLDALEHFDVVGCLERLDAFLGAMKKRFGRRPLMLKTNRSPAVKQDKKYFESSSDEHKKLMELLAADIYIYEKLFDGGH